MCIVYYVPHTATPGNVLYLGYLYSIFQIVMLYVYSECLSGGHCKLAMYFGTTKIIPEGVFIAWYCISLIFTASLLIGIHAKKTSCMKAFYHYAITTTIVVLLIQSIDGAGVLSTKTELDTSFQLLFGVLFFQIYILVFVRTLLKKMEKPTPEADVLSTV